MAKKVLKAEEIKYIIENYLKMPIREMARNTGLSRTLIKSRMKEMNLVLSEKILEKRANSTRFQKGQVPYNKGLKQSQYMSSESIERTKATRFQLHSKPHNTKEMGHESFIGGYWWVKLSDGVKAQKHKLIWEKANGEVPIGWCLRFKDGDPNNCALENLELISREENMLRNSKLNIPEEVVPAMAGLAMLRKSIKSKEDGEEQVK